MWSRQNLETPMDNPISAERRFVVGMLDEVEFNKSPEEAAAHPVWGPFDSYDEAADWARRLSSDPNEGRVVELLSPAGWGA